MTMVWKACGLTVLLGALSASAVAADDFGNSFLDTVVYTGVDYVHSDVENALGASSGFLTALNGDIGSSGWIVSGNFGAGIIDGAAIDSTSIYGTALVGYKWQLPSFYATASAGAHLASNQESPSGGPNDTSRAGAVVQYSFETQPPVNNLYVQSYGSASSAFGGQFYGHLKLGYVAEGLRYGLELTGFAGDDGDTTLRYGAFVGSIPITDTLFISTSAGYQDDLNANSRDGFYVTLAFTKLFDFVDP